MSNVTLILMRLDECKLIDLPRINDPRGNLTFLETERHVPFKFKRVYYLYDGHEKTTFHLNRSYYGLYIPPMIWRKIDNFSSGSVCLALASDYYTEDDYYRDYDQFLEAARQP